MAETCTGVDEQVCVGAPGGCLDRTRCCLPGVPYTCDVGFACYTISSTIGCYPTAEPSPTAPMTYFASSITGDPCSSDGWCSQCDPTSPFLAPSVYTGGALTYTVDACGPTSGITYTMDLGTPLPGTKFSVNAFSTTVIHVTVKETSVHTVAVSITKASTFIATTVVKPPPTDVSTSAMRPSSIVPVVKPPTAVTTAIRAGSAAVELSSSTAVQMTPSALPTTEPQGESSTFYPSTTEIDIPESTLSTVDASTLSSTALTLAPTASRLPTPIASGILSLSAIAGIVSGVVLLAAVVLAIFYYRRHRIPREEPIFIANGRRI